LLECYEKVARYQWRNYDGAREAAAAAAVGIQVVGGTAGRYATTGKYHKVSGKRFNLKYHRYA